MAIDPHRNVAADELAQRLEEANAKAEWMVGQFQPKNVYVKTEDGGTRLIGSFETPALAIQTVLNHNQCLNDDQS